MRFAEFLLPKSTRVTPFVYVFLFAAFVVTPQSASLHAQSSASAAGQDETARPLQLADSSTGSDATAAKKSPIGQQSQKLYKMALDLNKEVNRTTEQTVSAAAMRKADEIEEFVKELATARHENARR